MPRRNKLIKKTKEDDEEWIAELNGEDESGCSEADLEIYSSTEDEYINEEEEEDIIQNEEISKKRKRDVKTNNVSTPKNTEAVKPRKLDFAPRKQPMKQKEESAETCLNFNIMIESYTREMIPLEKATIYLTNNKKYLLSIEETSFENKQYMGFFFVRKNINKGDFKFQIKSSYLPDLTQAFLQLCSTHGIPISKLECRCFNKKQHPTEWDYCTIEVGNYYEINIKNASLDEVYTKNGRIKHLIADNKLTFQEKTLSINRKKIKDETPFSFYMPVDLIIPITHSLILICNTNRIRFCTKCQKDLTIEEWKKKQKTVKKKHSN